MPAVAGWGMRAQAGYVPRCVPDAAGVGLPYGVPVWHALQLDAAYDGLGFLHAPVGAEVFMQPPKARGVLAFVGRFPAFAMVFVRPDLAPQCWAVVCDLAAFRSEVHPSLLQSL